MNKPCFSQGYTSTSCSVKPEATIVRKIELDIDDGMVNARSQYSERIQKTNFLQQIPVLCKTMFIDTVTASRSCLAQDGVRCLWEQLTCEDMKHQTTLDAPLWTNSAGLNMLRWTSIDIADSWCSCKSNTLYGRKGVATDSVRRTSSTQIQFIDRRLTDHLDRMTDTWV